MNGLLGKDRINIVNDSGVLMDGYIWLMTSIGNTLMRFNVENGVLEYVETFKEIEIRTHSVSYPYTYGRYLYILPGVSDKIVKYNVDTKAYMYIEIRGLKETLYSRAYIHGEKMYIFSAHSEAFYIYDLINDKVEMRSYPKLAEYDYQVIKGIGEYVYLFNFNGRCLCWINLDDLSIHECKNNNIAEHNLKYYPPIAELTRQMNEESMDHFGEIFIAQKFDTVEYFFSNETAQYGIIENNRVLIRKYPENYVNVDVVTYPFDVVWENGNIKFLLPRYGNMVMQIEERGIYFIPINMDVSVLKYFEQLIDCNGILHESEMMGLKEYLQLLLKSGNKENRMTVNRNIGKEIYRLI